MVATKKSRIKIDDLPKNAKPIFYTWGLILPDCAS